MLGTLERSTILRLRVFDRGGSDLDPLALRGRLDSVLSDVSLEPRLPPSATLFIRKFEDPLPGSIQLDSPHARAPHAWRQAFQTRFDRLVSSAARPAHGYVPDSAESVVFYDYAELLACLTADWCSGSALTRWWWQALLKRGDLSWLVRKFWREQTEYVPAALEHVVRKGVLVEFVSRLSDVEVREIVQRVLSTFGVTRILRIENADFFVLDEAREVNHVAHVARSEMPWHHVVPESATPTLRPVQQFFVGIVLMVHRAPSRVRTLTFAREVEHWVQEQLVELQSIQAILTHEIPEPESFTPPESVAPIRENPIHADLIDVEPPPPPTGSVKSVVKKPDPITIANVTFHYEEPEPTPEVVTVAPIIQSAPIIETPTQTITSESLDPATIQTNLGGLFYLINLAIFLEIYNDFTSPVEQLHDDLSIWDFVTIVGKELDPETVDPIWELLNDLADREDELTTPPWLSDLLPHIRARLHLALGIDDDLAEILLHHEARITLTPTHAHVFFSLSDHPIEIRLSGLDRNPGWVPAAGRFIAFHYD